MKLTPYRLVLAQPRMRAVTLLGFLSRIPATAAGMTITLHVITTLDLGYAAAGMAGALGMLGIGIGSPLAGWFVDRLGPRPVLVVTTIAQGLYWAVAPSLGYQWLVITAFLSGVLCIPVFGLMRQYMAALVPTEQRRTAFAVDSMAVELSYMLGPALAVAGVTAIGSVVTMYAVGAGLVAAGVAMIVMNPPVQSEEEARDTSTVPRRAWLNRGLIAILLGTATTTFVLSATELSVVATLNNAGATAWTGLVIALWCVYSLIGGFVYGGLRRSVSPVLLIAGLGVMTLPVALVAGGWWWLLALVLIPGGLLTAPSLAATVDSVSSCVPASARGEAMGLHGTALTIGIAAGSPIAGAVIDGFGAAWGYVMAGGIGLLLILGAMPFWPRQAEAHQPAASAPSGAPSGSADPATSVEPAPSSASTSAAPAPPAPSAASAASAPSAASAASAEPAASGASVR
jgi:MFS family permease